MVIKKRNIQWAADLWVKCLVNQLQRSDENGQTGSVDRKATVTQITTRYNRFLQKNISDWQQMSHSRRRHTDYTNKSAVNAWWCPVIWTKISEEHFRYLVESMPWRFKPVLKAKGDHSSSTAYLVKSVYIYMHIYVV